MAKEKEIYHWADKYAEQIIRSKGDKKEYVIAAGITPSGTIHMGNFREVITQEIIKRALESKGKKVRFFYSWDDFDVLRKVPKNMPKQEMLKENLRKAISDVPDPFGCHDSYALHNEKEMEEEVPKVGINPEFLYQHELYKKGVYNDVIKIALENTEKIKEILNKFRKEDLPKEWLPIAIFCPKCGKDTVDSLGYVGGYEIEYKCECGSEEKIDFNKVKGVVKLKWRIDWPARWHYYNEDFESAGKDHFASGGSVTTSRMIQKEVYGTEPPFGFAYEWIGIRGRGQFASSAGVVVTLKEMLEVYEPEMIRWLFASSRPNAEFSITFEVDIIKLYEDFDKCERIYFDVGEFSEKNKAKQSRIYELSCIDKVPKKIPYQPSFRHLTNVLQVNELDVEKTIGYYEKELKDKFDKDRLRVRAECARNWIEKYAPEEFKFKVQENCQVTLVKEQKKILGLLASKLMEKEWTDVELHEEMYILCTNEEFPPKDFFKLVYQVLVNKEKGPRLASFILEIGKDRVADLLSKI